jgi:adenylosuccinate synthase
MDADRARRLICMAAERANARLRALQEDPISAEEVADNVLALRNRILPMLTDTGREILAVLARPGTRVLLEGAQGAMLDVDHGTYPYVTSSSTTSGGAAIGVGIGPTVIDAVIGVVKAYTTRVGSGPLPTEMESPLAEQLRELGAEYGATTGRPRRCGWFDAVVVRYSAQVNGLTGLAVTKLDVLDTFAELNVCVAYEADGEIHHSFPYDLALLERAKPVYETLPGWRSVTSGARSYEDLPREARNYLERLQTLTGVPIEYVSVGSARDQIIRLR